MNKVILLAALALTGCSGMDPETKAGMSRALLAVGGELNRPPPPPPQPAQQREYFCTPDGHGNMNCR